MTTSTPPILAPIFAPILSPIARLLLASPFLLSGPLKVMGPVAAAGYMASGGLPASPTLAVAVGVFEVLAAVALVLGWQARTAAVLLAAFTLVASLLFHAYWAAPADQQFVVQLLFTKNIAIVGGLLVVAAFGAGPCSLDGRTHAPRRPATHGYEA